MCYPFPQATTSIVRWSAREMCMSTFLERYECILQTLDQIQTELSFVLKHRSEAAGLLSSMNLWLLLPCLRRYLQKRDL